MREAIPKTRFQLAPHSLQSQIRVPDVPPLLQDSQLSCAHVLHTCYTCHEEFVLARTVWFLVSLFTSCVRIHHTLLAIPIKVSLIARLFTFTFGVGPDPSLPPSRVPVEALEGSPLKPPLQVCLKGYLGAPLEGELEGSLEGKEWAGGAKREGCGL